MAAKKAAISISVIADAAKARAGFAEAERAAGGLSNQLKTVGKTVAGAFATQAIFNFAKGALNAAEAANTSRSRIEQVATSMNVFGDEVGAVTDRLTKLADQTARNTGIDQNQIKLTQAKLLTFKELAVTADEVGGAFDRATMAAIDMAAAGFGEASTNAVQLGKALNDPIKGITALSRSGITFTEQQKDVISSLVETNRVGEAQALILEAIEQQIGGVAEATANDTDKMRVSFTQLKESVGQALVPVFASLLEVIKPIIDTFVALPSGIQKTIVLVGLAAATFKSLSTTMQGFGLAAGTANKALGAVGLVLTAAVGIYSIYNKGKKEAAQRTADFVTALNEEASSQTNAVEKHIASILAAEDLSDIYTTLGLSIQDVANIIQGQSNPTFEDLEAIVGKVRSGQMDLAMANKELGDRFDLTFNQAKGFVAEITNQEQALASAREEVARNEAAQEGLGLETERTRQATQAATQATEEQEEALNKLLTATLAQFNAALQYESQQWRTKDAIDAYTTAQLEAAFGNMTKEEADRLVAESSNDAASAALSQAAAAAKLAQDQATARGETLSAAEAAQIQVDELSKLAQALSPGDPLRQRLQQYIDQLNGIPPEKNTNVNIFETTYRTVIEQIQQARETAGTQSGMGSGRNAGILPTRAQGGPVSPTLAPYIVGEEGPELFVPGQSGMILPNTALIDGMAKRAVSPNGMAGATVVVNVAGSVTSEKDLVESIRQGLLRSQQSGRAVIF